MGFASVGHCTYLIRVLFDTSGRLGGGSTLFKERTKWSKVVRHLVLSSKTQP